MSGTMHLAGSPKNLVRPWDRRDAPLEELDHVRTESGPAFGHALFWIPGVVLAPVEAQSQSLAVMTDLVVALGRAGTSHGVLMLYPGISRASLPDETTLAKGRIRVVEENDYATFIYGGLGDLPTRYLASLGGASRERISRLRQRRRHS